MALGGYLPQINLGVQGVTQGGHHSSTVHPLRPPDIPPLNFFFWEGHERPCVRDPVDSEMDLVTRIVTTTGIVRDMPGVFENVRQPIQQHCESCVHENGCGS
ncbi:hypothetical protein TNCV_1527481 [Trichonephila clavipes]|nr:hypothetical protein TNCV_1527481 [Trichonephila clavipes]